MTDTTRRGWRSVAFPLFELVCLGSAVYYALFYSDWDQATFCLAAALYFKVSDND